MPLREVMIRKLLPFVKNHGVDALLMVNDRFAMCGMQLLIVNGYRIPENLAPAAMTMIRPHGIYTHAFRYCPAAF